MRRLDPLFLLLAAASIAQAQGFQADFGEPDPFAPLSELIVKGDRIVACVYPSGKGGAKGAWLMDRHPPGTVVSVAFDPRDPSRNGRGEIVAPSRASEVGFVVGVVSAIAGLPGSIRLGSDTPDLREDS